MNLLGRWMLAAVCCLLVGTSWAVEMTPLRIGVMAYRTPELMQQRYAGLADYLSQELDGRPVELRVMGQAELDQAANRHQIDLLLTNPHHYLILRSHNRLSGVIATLARRGPQDQLVTALGGVIIARADNDGVAGLSDLPGRQVAIFGEQCLAGYVAQVFELNQRGYSVEQLGGLLSLNTHDAVARAVIDRQAEVGFLRSGVIEDMQSRGDIPVGSLKVINPQSLRGYPYAVSTLLYPEWPVVSLPHLPLETVSRVAAALLGLRPEQPAARAAGIAGFVPPQDYLGVEQAVRALRLPPYDSAPNFGWQDVWSRHRVVAAEFIALLLLALSLAAGLWWRGRQLRRQSRDLAESHRQMGSLLDSLIGMAYRCRDDDYWTMQFISEGVTELTGFQAADLIGNRRLSYEEVIVPEDRMRVRRHVRRALGRHKQFEVEYRIRHRDGRVRSVIERGSGVFDPQGKVTAIEGFVADITDHRQAASELYRSRRRLEVAGKLSYDLLYELDAQSGAIRWFGDASWLLGRDVAELNQHQFRFEGLVHPEDRGRRAELLSQHLDSREPLELEYRVRHSDGEYRILRERALPLGAQAPELWVGACVDITRERRREDQLQLMESAFRQASEGILISDADNRIVDVNAAFCRMTGYSRDECIGGKPRLFKSDEQDDAFYRDMWRQLQRTGRWSGEIWDRRRNGEVYPQSLNISAIRDEQGRVRHFVAIAMDISAMKEQQKQLEYVARFDALTGLPNRVLLADRLQQSMAQSRREQQLLAVAYIDLDGFKEINDTHGHAVGDQFLVTMANRLRITLRETDTVARIGGDEFIAVIGNLQTADQCMAELDRLLRAASSATEVEGHSLRATASIGVTFYPQRDGAAVDPDQLIRQADQAMYQAKLQGKNRYCLFDTEMDRDLRGQNEERQKLRDALQADCFELYYQPKVNLRTGQLLGAEALLRLHSGAKLVPPAQILPMVQNDPLAVEIGEWVIRRALRQLQAWQLAGLKTQISVNIDAYHLQRADFVTRLQQMLADLPLVDPQQLQLEVLETSALQDIHKVARVMRAAGELGVSFAIDDFGTGYSSLTYLKHLPAAELKIDRSFVRDALDDPDDLAILEGVVGLAAAFQRGVIAEGVETREHGELLLQLGCERAQGYMIARPMPAEDLLQWLRDWQPEASWRDQPVIGRARLPLLFARVEHRAQCHNVEEALRADRSLADIVGSPCRFASWIASARQGIGAGRADLKVLQQLHDEFHRLLDELEALQQRKGSESALARLDELVHVHVALQGALSRELGLDAVVVEPAASAATAVTPPPAGPGKDTGEGDRYTLF